MKKAYRNLKLHSKTLATIGTANSIIEEFAAKGFDITLRQLYYQFIARNLFSEDRRWTWMDGRWRKDPNGTKNADPNYKWLGGFINDGRLAGLVDWNSIVDRTRRFRANNHWDCPLDIIMDAERWYARDTREHQEVYVEVWIEKDALVGIVEKACDPLDVGYLSCRGFVSQSAMYRAALRFKSMERNGLVTIILHLGDHDPSGLDMTRDIQDRLRMFESSVEVQRIALNMDQIKKYNPPPNYAKSTDSRYADYAQKYGDNSWELDALDPQVLTELITEEVSGLTNEEGREASIARQERERQEIQEVIDNWYG